MKVKNLFLGSLACLAFAACSDDNEAMNNVQADATKGYMTFNVELPSMATTRAENDQFAEGASEEYYVGDIHIVLLSDSKEILQVKSDLTTQWNNPENEDNNVERISVNISVKTEKSPASALVILNKPTDVTFTEGDIWDDELTLTEKAVSHFYDNATGTNKVAKGITMTNAAIVVGGDIQDLTPITAANIATTEAEAKANPVIVYVERVIAKVSVSQNDAELDGTSVPTGVAKVTIDDWKLDITNKSTYLMRQYESDWATTGYTAEGESGNRMIGTATNPQRVYWANDLNYSDGQSYDASAFDMISSMEGANTLTDVAYCLENTFDVANQNQDQTTRVVFGTTIYTEAAAQDLFTVGSGSTLYDAENLVKVIANVATEQGVTPGTLATVISDAAAGTYALTATNLTTLLGVTVADAEATAINAALGTITCYKDGKCYYAARIKHFGDELTPWDPETDPNYGADPTATQNWLGRYGVVRNNWYELTVTAIKKIGYATVNDIPEEDTPDDEKTNYLEFQINILSWAKRSQDVEL